MLIFRNWTNLVVQSPSVSYNVAMNLSVMDKLVLSIGLLLLDMQILPAQQQHHQPLVTFESPTKCQSAHGSWRWAAKTSTEMPSKSIDRDHHVRPSDIAAWEVPDRDIKSRSPRFGREVEWFVVTGRVALVKTEEDGDLHIELCDANNPRSVHVVVEVPLDRHGGETPWNPIRETVFGWSDQKFPFETRIGHKLHLLERPMVQVVGLAFYDAKHNGREPNRRRTAERVAVWEIHPVMALALRSDLDWQ